MKARRATAPCARRRNPAAARAEKRRGGRSCRRSGVAAIRSQDLLGAARPRSPVGRNTSTSTRIEKMITSVQRTARYWPPSDSMSPISTPPSMAPGRLPMPPSTAAVNARRPGGVADDEARIVVVEPEDQAGGAGQRRAEEEGDDDHPVDVDAHHARRLLVLGGRLHRLAHLGAAHEVVQRDHERDRHGPEQHLAQAQYGLADLPAATGIGFV